MAEIIEIPVDNPVVFTRKEWTGVGIFFVFFLLILISLLIGNTPENREKRRKYFKEQELRKKRRYEEAENNPDINTRDQSLHARRLEKFNKSRYKGTTYYIGPRGGYYWIAMDGTKVYR